MLAHNESYTPAECYAACNVLLNSPPEFLFNVFFDNGTYHCTCCLECLEQRPVEGAEVYATCTNDVVIGDKLHPKHAQPGKKLQYLVAIARAASRGKRSRGAMEGIGVRITLPAGVAFLNALAAPRLRAHSKGPQKCWTHPDSLEVADGGGQVLTWNSISISSRQKVQLLAVRVRVLGADLLLRLGDTSGRGRPPSGNKRIYTIPLTFGASVFQLGGANGTQFTCERAAPSRVAEVQVKRKTEALWWKRDARSASVTK